jgi:hypothetical protein
MSVLNFPALHESTAQSALQLKRQNYGDAMDNEKINSALQVPPLSETARHFAAYPASIGAPPK